MSATYTDDFDIEFPGPPGESQADILRRTGQFGVLPTDTDAEVMSKLAAVPAAVFTSAQRFGTLAEREAIPLGERKRGLRFLVTVDGDGNPIWRVFEWRLAGDPSGPLATGEPRTSAGWEGLYTEWERKNLGIGFFGKLAQENVAGTLFYESLADDLAKIDKASVGVRVSDFRARALSGSSPLAVALEWDADGAIDGFDLSWGVNYSVHLGPGVRTFRPPVWQSQTVATLTSDSMGEAKGYEATAAALGLTLNNVSKFSSGALQPYRLGTRPIYLTVTGNTIPASGAGVGVTAINGAAPGFVQGGDGFEPQRFLNTYPGDTISTNCSVSGTLAGRRGVVSVPNGGTPTYTFTPNDGVSVATTATPQSIFIPDNLAHLSTDELWIRLSQNYFYADYTPVFPNNINPRVLDDIQAIVERARGQRIIILALTPGNDMAPATSKKGTALRYFNNQLRTRWPQYAAWLKNVTYSGQSFTGNNMDFIRQFGRDGSANDQADYDNGLLPRSCMADDPHLNAKGQALEQAFLQLYRAAQQVPPTITADTIFNLTATGTNPRTSAVTTASASASILSGTEATLYADVAALKAAGGVGGSPYYATRAAGAAAVATGGFFTSNESGALRRYERTATAPNYADRGPVVSKADVGLGSADNTPDTDKPISTAQAAALTLKASVSDLALTTTIASRVKSPEMFGTVAGTDSTTALTTASNALKTTSGVLSLTPGLPYRMNARFDIGGVKNTVIDGNMQLLKQIGENHTLYALPGASNVADFSTEPVLPMVGDYTRGATSLVLATPSAVSAFAPGDYIWIRSRQCITPKSGDAVRQPVAELNKVKSVDPATGTINLRYPLVKDYIKDTVNNDPYKGGLFPHGVVVATGAASITAENLVIRNLIVDDQASFNKYAAYFRQVWNVTFENCTFNCKIGLVPRGRFIRIRGCNFEMATPLGTLFTGEYAIAPDTGTSDVWITDNYLNNINGFSYLHMHEGLANFHIARNTFMNALTKETDEGPYGCINLVGGSWNINIDQNTFINGPKARSGIATGIGGIRSVGTWAADQGHVGLNITRNIFIGKFGDFPLDVSDINGGTVRAYVNANRFFCTTDQAYIMRVSTPGAFVTNNECPRDKILVNNSTSVLQHMNMPVSLVDLDYLTADGARISQRATGLDTPRLLFENIADGKAVTVRMGADGTLIFGTDATPRASSGTSTMLLRKASQLTSDGLGALDILVRLAGANVSKQIQVGAADSAGTGFRTLRISN